MLADGQAVPGRAPQATRKTLRRMRVLGRAAGHRSVPLASHRRCHWRVARRLLAERRRQPAG
eukprot:8210198-Alexandrium_andersonii.AAC.1